jgi:RNA polymerase sigma-70 factor (ECF subfamily)
MGADDDNSKPRAVADWTALQQHRRYLLRYAMLQLRDAAAAEDVVQETLLAAIEGSSSFSGKSSLRTWLTGILKHKIIDHLRRRSREQPLGPEEAEDERSEAERIDILFREDGHWRNFPSEWANPDASLENQDFWKVFEKCCNALPPKVARVFMMREVMELSTEEICKELAITATYCWVMLHRARLSLRECLESKWFGRR